MAETTGENWRERADRIERVLDHLVQSAATHDGQIGALAKRHEEFESSMAQLLNSQKQLLTAQVVLTDRVEKLAVTMTGLAEAQKRTDAKVADVSDNLSALIRVVDGLVKRNPN